MNINHLEIQTRDRKSNWPGWTSDQKFLMERLEFGGNFYTIIFLFC